MFNNPSADMTPSAFSLNSPKSALSDSKFQGLSPKSALSKPYKIQITSPKITPEHSKGFYSRPKLQNKLNKKQYPKISPIKQRLAKTAHSSYNFQSQNCNKNPDLAFAKAYIPFKDVLINYSKENSSKADKVKSNVAKRRKFDASTFFLQLKSKNSPVKFPALSSQQQSSVDSFIKDFSIVAKKVDLTQSGRLNYSKFCQVLNQLGFISDPICKSEEETQLVLRCWKILGGFVEHKVLFEDFFLFLLVVVGLPLKIKQFPNTKQKKMLWVLTQKELSDIPEEFQLFNTNRNQPVTSNDESQSSSQEISEYKSEEEIQILDRSIKISNDNSEKGYLSAGEIEQKCKNSPFLHLPNKSDHLNTLGVICLSKIVESKLTESKSLKPDLNSTVLIKKDSIKYAPYNGISEKLGDSMIYESNLLNVSELPFLSQNPTKRRPHRQNSLVLEKKYDKESD